MRTRLLPIFGIVLLLTNCKKEETAVTPDPDLAASVAGTYTGTRVYSNGQSAALSPTGSNTIGITITRINNTAADISLRFNTNGQVSTNTYTSTLTQSGSSITYKSGTAVTGTITGKLLEFRLATTTGATSGVDATKN